MSRQSNNEPVECGDFAVIRSTAKALLVVDPDEGEHWIPKSQICDESYLTAESEEGDQGALTLPEWLAIDKGFA